jgi:type I restriction enzyme S subunit
MMLIRAGAATNPVFLEMVLNSPLITEIARGMTTGGAAPRVNVATVKAYPIPLPPLAEQHRIVAKVHELMDVCDRLETQLTTAQTDSRRLLEALLHEALAPAV